MAQFRIVGVSGSLSSPSRTAALVREVSSQLAAGLDAEVEIIDLATLAPDLAGGIRRAELGAAAQEALLAVESADVLVVGSPAYRAAYTGLFKHFFDFVGQYDLVDTPVVLTATGGSDRHALLVEHQLRPLFGFFQSLTLPMAVYANESDFVAGEVASIELEERIALTVRRSLPVISSHLNRAGVLS
ncbi:MAG: msuE [Homoserinimonas sp.]|nr:msuE [Homoserinimonas sp.]